MFEKKIAFVAGLSAFGAVVAPVAVADIVSFQNGVNGYAGTFDRKIGITPTADANGANVNTDSKSFSMDGGNTDLNDSLAVQGLIRFDNLFGGGAGQIPTGAMIISASLDMVTTGQSNSQSNGAYSVYRMNTAFDGTTTWASLGGDGIYNDVGRFGGSFNRPAISAPTSARVDRIVQDWSDGTAANLGFGIRSDNNVDAWSFHTTGAPDVQNHPKLTVQYTTNPAARLVRYQQNVNGYTGTTDAFINGINGSTVNAVVPGAAIEQGFLDGSNAATGGTDSFDQPYLIKFNDIDLTMPSITRAELTIRTGFTSDASGSGGKYAVYRILKPWDMGTTYKGLDGDGDPTINSAAELIASGFLADGPAMIGPIGNAASLTVDVTGMVQAWRDGAENDGFYILASGTSDGWQIFTSGAFGVNGVDDVSGQLTPELSILYNPDPVPEPAGLAGVAIAAAGMLARRRDRRRSTRAFGSANPPTHPSLILAR